MARGQDPCSHYCGVIARFGERLRRGLPVEIFGDGEQIRDFTYIGDAIAALLRAPSAADASAPIFNVCTGTGTTVRRLAETMAALHRTALVACHRPARSGETSVSIGDPRHAAQGLGFKAETTLREGLATTLDMPDPAIAREARLIA
jgi:UDP-glucose 4-epimerase